MATTPSIEHPSIGQIHGTQPSHLPQIEQYLGIQYARLTNRFARGTLVERYSGPVSAANIGPLPVADAQNCDREHLLIQHALEHQDFKFSDTDCLTLNITVPAQGTRSGVAGLLPVVVFVHGGGFVTGSANWPQYDLGPLVKQSVEIGKPTVAVGINYRLGPFGFLTSSAMRDAGFKANNGLHDQKLALRWIKQYISGFGGNPSQITFLGSSVGAASGFFHLQSAEPLFDQLIALGGNPLIQPVPATVAEIAYGIVTAALGLDNLPPSEQVKGLLEIPAEELSTKLSNVSFPVSAVVDGEIVKSIPTYAGLHKVESLEDLFPGAHWCKTILMGDSQFDGMIMDVTALGHRTDNLAGTLKKSLETVLPDNPATVSAILNGYGVDESNTDRLPVLHFINDISFARGAKAPAQAWAQAGPRLTTKAFLTHFNMPNPWTGPWQGHATHALDISILLGNYDEFLSQGQRACGERMAGGLLSLVHGQEPFPSYSGTQDGVTMVYFAGADSKVDESYTSNESEEHKTKRRGILDQVAAGNPGILDKLLATFGLFIQGP